jgi:hypothetical protein
MEGRYPNGLLLAITRCNDASKEDEFAYWYNHIHFPDVTASGIFGCPIRFANTDPDSPHGQYAATYETDYEDVTNALPANREALAKLRPQGDRSSELIESVFVDVFKRTGGEFSTSVRPTRGILIVLSNCKDPSREEEFNRWYEDVHFPDILNVGQFHTAYRYENVNSEFSAKYLAIYETDNPDPLNAREQHLALMEGWGREGRLFSDMEVVSSMTARRAWPSLA